MRRLLIGTAAVAMLLSIASAQASAQQPLKGYLVELDAETGYFAPGTVRIAAVSNVAGRVEVGELTVTRRQRITVQIPADASELTLTGPNGAAARVRLTAKAGTILVRPLAKSSSFRDVGWALGVGRRVEAERLYVEFKSE